MYVSHLFNIKNTFQPICRRVVLSQHTIQLRAVAILKFRNPVHLSNFKNSFCQEIEGKKRPNENQLTLYYRYNGVTNITRIVIRHIESRFSSASKHALYIELLCFIFSLLIVLLFPLRHLTTVVISWAHV